MLPLDTLCKRCPLCNHFRHSRLFLSHAKPDMLSAVEEKLLFALYRFHFLTIDQIVTYLGVSVNSANWIREKLRSLMKRGFVDTQYLPRLTPYGRLPLVYMFGTEAVSHFRGCPITRKSASYRVIDVFGEVTSWRHLR